MVQLTPNWLTEGLIDFEYKKYLLLAYLQYVSKNFSETLLYPFLSDMVFHSNNLRMLREKKEMASTMFPKSISKVDLEKFKVHYQQLIDDENLEEIETIIEFAIPKMSEHLREGQELYDFVESNITIWPVGILPVHTEEGYMLIEAAGDSDTKAYEYRVTIFETPAEKYRGIKVKYLSSYSRGLTSSLEAVKLDLVRNHKQFVNPATFAVSSGISFPLNETLLPVAKRSLVRYLSNVSEA